jgi:hypothetical protein
MLKCKFCGVATPLTVDSVPLCWSCWSTGVLESPQAGAQLKDDGRLRTPERNMSRDLIARSDKLISGFEHTLISCMKAHLDLAETMLHVGFPSTRTQMILRVLERVRRMQARISDADALRKIELQCADLELELQAYTSSPQPPQTEVVH